MKSNGASMEENDLLSFVCFRPPRPKGAGQRAPCHSTPMSQTGGPRTEVRAAR